MSGQVGQHGGWLFSVNYQTFDTWAYLATKLDLTHEARGTVKATNATEAKAAVQGLIDSGNLNEAELKVKP